MSYIEDGFLKALFESNMDLDKRYQLEYMIISEEYMSRFCKFAKESENGDEAAKKLEELGRANLIKVYECNESVYIFDINYLFDSLSLWLLYNGISFDTVQVICKMEITHHAFCCLCNEFCDNNPEYTVTEEKAKRILTSFIEKNGVDPYKIPFTDLESIRYGIEQKTMPIMCYKTPKELVHMLKNDKQLFYDNLRAIYQRFGLNIDYSIDDLEVFHRECKDGIYQIQIEFPTPTKALLCKSVIIMGKGDNFENNYLFTLELSNNGYVMCSIEKDGRRLNFGHIEEEYFLEESFKKYCKRMKYVVVPSEDSPEGKEIKFN